MTTLGEEGCERQRLLCQWLPPDSHKQPERLLMSEYDIRLARNERLNLGRGLPLPSGKPDGRFPPLVPKTRHSAIGPVPAVQPTAFSMSAFAVRHAKGERLQPARQQSVRSLRNQSVQNAPTSLPRAPLPPASTNPITHTAAPANTDPSATPSLSAPSRTTDPRAPAKRTMRQSAPRPRSQPIGMPAEGPGPAHGLPRFCPLPTPPSLPAHPARPQHSRPDTVDCRGSCHPFPAPQSRPGAHADLRHTRSDHPHPRRASACR